MKQILYTIGVVILLTLFVGVDKADTYYTDNVEHCHEPNAPQSFHNQYHDEWLFIGDFGDIFMYHDNSNKTYYLMRKENGTGRMCQISYVKHLLINENYFTHWINLKNGFTDSRFKKGG